jgi:coenzyme F420-reducing hydrogenase delta subunit
MTKRLYIQLYNSKTGESITLPLNPEETEIPNQKDTNSYNILDYGEVGVRGNKKLKRISLSNIFPNNDTYFSLLASLVKQLDYKPYNLNETIDMINRWVDEDAIIRVIISGHLNSEFQIESFSQGIKESVEAVGYTIDLVEYRNPEANNARLEGTENKFIKLKKRAMDKFIPNQQVMKAGQTIYKLAKLTYGGKFEELAQRNKITNLNKDLAGQIVEMLPL